MVALLPGGAPVNGGGPSRPAVGNGGPSPVRNQNVINLFSLSTVRFNKEFAQLFLTTFYGAAIFKLNFPGAALFFDLTLVHGDDLTPYSLSIKFALDGFANVHAKVTLGTGRLPLGADIGVH